MERLSLGSKIRDFRKERNLTLGQLAARINVSASFLSVVERDLKRPTIPMLKKISDALNIPITYLLAEASVVVTGDKLRLMRQGRRLTVEELAELSEIPAEHIRAFEAGTSQPDLEQTERLAQALNVTVRYFLERTTRPGASLGQRLRRLRQSRGLSLAALADKVGVSVSLLSQIENNQTIPSLETMERLAENLGTTATYFLMEQEDVEDLLASLGPDVLEMLGDPRVQAFLRAVRDFSSGELQYVLNYIQFFKKNRQLLE